jgi:tripartite-type tricarboxylate transporter receptor subunit TctC
MKRFLLATCLALSAMHLQGQEYPTRPVRVVAAFTPGSGVDLAARLVAEKLSQAFKQPFIVENRVGAAGTIATAFVAAAPPDGHTLLVNASGYTMYMSLYRDLPFDTARDLIGVAPLAELPLVLVSSPAKNWRSLQEVIAHAKTNSAGLIYGTAGIASAVHIAIERLRTSAQFDGVHVPFKGTPEAVTEVLAGRIDVTFTQVFTALPGVRDNRLVPLAISGRKRSAALPNVPTTTEAGYPESDYTAWVGMMTSSRTPRAIVERLNQETLKALSSPDALERITRAGQEPMPMTVEQFNAQIHAELTSNPGLAKAAGIKPQ